MKGSNTDFRSQINFSHLESQKYTSSGSYEHSQKPYQPKHLKEINILILGQSGVGKSTWINSIINYLQYSTLEEAKSNYVNKFIPTSINFIKDKGESDAERVVHMREADPNAGKSATKEPNTYKLQLKNTLIRLIDTPGIGDTEGLDQDKINMQKIIHYISFYTEIHGIVIVMKSNQKRIDAIFEFCLKELMRNLHQNAAKNIIFCFTFSRSNFYELGDTYYLLHELMKNIHIDDIIDLENKTFCLDNEAFQYLCTLKEGHISGEERSEEYNASWNHSASETKRLLKRIAQFEPHLIKDTTSLCKIKTQLLTLVNPISEIIKLIETNLVISEDYKKKSAKLHELKSFFRFELRPKVLDYPRTVCNSVKCITIVKNTETDTTTFKNLQICHQKCRLKNILPNILNDSIRECYSMTLGSSKNPQCKNCGCYWYEHIHQTYEIETHERTRINAKTDIKNISDSKRKLEEEQKKLERLCSGYKAEKDIIIQTCIKFAIFLKQNTIVTCADYFTEYLQYLIRGEERKINKTQLDDSILKGLKHLLVYYTEQLKKMETNIKNQGRELIPTPEEIYNLEQELFRLKFNGEQIKNLFRISMESNLKAHGFTERDVPGIFNFEF